MYSYFLVFIGGGLGSVCRFGIAEMLKSYLFIFPLATFIANSLSCIVLGYFLGLSLHAEGNAFQKSLIMTGFCGGFSTFSTFTNETLQLFQSGQILYAIANVVFNLVVCWGCIYLGMKLAGS